MADVADRVEETRIVVVDLDVVEWAVLFDLLSSFPGADRLSLPGLVFGVVGGNGDLAHSSIKSGGSCQAIAWRGHDELTASEIHQSTFALAGPMPTQDR